jgi:flagellar hook-length control protein FliK
LLSSIQNLDSPVSTEPQGSVSSTNSFQKYLDDEQKRLAILFSPFNQYDFSAWFNYGDFSSAAQTNTSPEINLFADLNQITTSNNSDQGNSGTQQNNSLIQADKNFTQLIPLNANQSTKQLLQNLLAQTGWLTPNIAALPQFQLAQFEGKLLPRLDLQALVDEIMTQVKLVKDKGRVELILGLKPDNMGEILLTLTSSAGAVAIQIQATDSTRKLLEQQMADLEAALKKAHINFSEIKVVTVKEVKEHA